MKKLGQEQNTLDCMFRVGIVNFKSSFNENIHGSNKTAQLNLHSVLVKTLIEVAA
jgi:hypothetical protein